MITMVGTMAVVLTSEGQKDFARVIFGVLSEMLFPALIALENFPAVGLSLRT